MNNLIINAKIQIYLFWYVDVSVPNCVKYIKQLGINNEDQYLADSSA